jgi:opacity protein-like surface antigen
MKKLLLSLTVVLLAGFCAMAQDKQVVNQPGFLIISAGPAFPVGDFASKNMDNEDAGLAHTGYGINLQWGYKFKSGIGLTVTGMYARNEVDINSFGNTEGLAVDHWQYYGGLIGPLYIYNVSKITTFDFSVQAGVIRANSPKLTYHGQEIMEEAWATAMPIRADVGVRFKVFNGAYLFTGVNYFLAKPEFKANLDGVEQEFTQKISNVGINAGIGVAF